MNITTAINRVVLIRTATQSTCRRRLRDTRSLRLQPFYRVWRTGASRLIVSLREIPAAANEASSLTLPVGKSRLGRDPRDRTRLQKAQSRRRSRVTPNRSGRPTGGSAASGPWDVGGRKRPGFAHRPQLATRQERIDACCHDGTRRRTSRLSYFVRITSVPM
jgi:hypothetical protein